MNLDTHTCLTCGAELLDITLPRTKIQLIKDILLKYYTKTQGYTKSDSPEIKTIDSISRLVIETDDYSGGK